MPFKGVKQSMSLPLCVFLFIENERLVFNSLAILIRPDGAAIFLPLGLILLFMVAWNLCHAFTNFHFSKTLSAFRDGDIDVLVSSDAMTRGMDVEGVRHVINYDMPPYIKTYIHRAGRTARAGQSGCCFTLLRNNEVKRFKKMLQKANNNSCSVHQLAADSIEHLRPMYSSALDKLKEVVESERKSKGNAGSYPRKPSKRKKDTDTMQD